MGTKSIISFIFLLQAIINSCSFTTAQKPNPNQQLFKCSDGNFKSNNLLESRDSALRALYKNFATPGTYHGHESGNSNDKVYSFGLCPPNIKKEACAECVNNTIPYLKNNCPKQKEGVAWTVLPKLNCMVHYADYRLEGKLAEWAWATFSTPNLTSANAGELEKGLNNLANKLKEPTARGGALEKYNTGSVTYGPGSCTLFGSMQCTPDINKDMCMKCLSDATREIHNCCSKKSKLGGIAMSTNCYYWYSHENKFSS